jgi:hypothetical protein
MTVLRVRVTRVAAIARFNVLVRDCNRVATF